MSVSTPPIFWRTRITMFVSANAHHGRKNVVLGALSCLEGLPALCDELGKRAAEPGDRDLPVGRERAQEFRPFALVAIKTPGLNELGAGVFVLDLSHVLAQENPMLCA